MTSSRLTTLGAEFGRTLTDKAFKEAETIWEKLDVKEYMAAKAEFYVAADVAYQAKLKEIEDEKRKQREKEKREAEFAAAKKEKKDAPQSDRHQ